MNVDKILLPVIMEKVVLETHKVGMLKREMELTHKRFGFIMI